MEGHLTFALLLPSFSSSDLQTHKVVVPRGTGLGLAVEKASGGSLLLHYLKPAWPLLKKLLNRGLLGHLGSHFGASESPNNGNANPSAYFDSSRE